MAVEEVGTGVGYVVCSVNASLLLFRGLGKAGEEESGSKAGKSDAVGFLAAEAGDIAVSERVVEGDMACWPSAIWQRIARIQVGQLEARIQSSRSEMAHVRLHIRSSDRRRSMCKAVDIPS